MRARVDGKRISQRSSVGAAGYRHEGENIESPQQLAKHDCRRVDQSGKVQQTVVAGCNGIKLIRLQPLMLLS